MTSVLGTSKGSAHLGKWELDYWLAAQKSPSFPAVLRLLVAVTLPAAGMGHVSRVFPLGSPWQTSLEGCHPRGDKGS